MNAAQTPSKWFVDMTYIGIVICAGFPCFPFTFILGTPIFIIFRVGGRAVAFFQWVPDVMHSYGTLHWNLPNGHTTKRNYNQINSCLLISRSHKLLYVKTWSLLCKWWCECLCYTASVAHDPKLYSYYVSSRAFPHLLKTIYMILTGIGRSVRFWGISALDQLVGDFPTMDRNWPFGVLRPLSFQLSLSALRSRASFGLYT